MLWWGYQSYKTFHLWKGLDSNVLASFNDAPLQCCITIFLTGSRQYLLLNFKQRFKNSSQLEFFGIPLSDFFLGKPQLKLSLKGELALNSIYTDMWLWIPHQWILFHSQFECNLNQTKRNKTPVAILVFFLSLCLFTHRSSVKKCSLDKSLVGWQGRRKTDFLVR